MPLNGSAFKARSADPRRRVTAHCALPSIGRDAGEHEAAIRRLVEADMAYGETARVHGAVVTGNVGEAHVAVEPSEHQADIGSARNPAGSFRVDNASANLRAFRNDRLSVHDNGFRQARRERGCRGLDRGGQDQREQLRDVRLRRPERGVRGYDPGRHH